MPKRRSKGEWVFDMARREGHEQLNFFFDKETNRWLDGPHDYLLSFVLAAPVDRRPDFVVMVAVDRPLVGLHGSEVAAPVAKRIAEHLLRQRQLFEEWGP